MLTLDYNEELNKEYDDMSCMTRDTGTERTVYRHAVDDLKSESDIKRSAAATRHLQDYMYRICHSPCKWEDIKHGDMIGVTDRRRYAARPKNEREGPRSSHLVAGKAECPWEFTW